MAEFEESPHVFFQDMEEQDRNFYDDDPNPSDHIWKKFELLPTPPRSPIHDAFEKEEQHLEMLDSHLHTSICNLADLAKSYNVDVQSKLIQDCMWSAGGLTAASMMSGGESPAKKSRCTEKQRSDSTSDTPTTVEIPSSECVDPIAVFPFPINEPRVTRRRPSCSDTPMTPSDSEEEEIDVVTVAEKNHKLHIHRRRTVLPASPSMSAQVAAMHNYSHCGPAIIVRSAPHSPAHHHSLKRQHPASSPGSPQPFVKRHRSGVNEAELRTVVQKLNMKHQGRGSRHGYSSSSQSSSRASSDSEEGGECKRAQHNVLERKRRNDLKTNFLQLRDALPGLRKEDKAAKVVILKRAVDHIHELQCRHRTLKQELDREEHVQQRLRQRLNALDFFN